MRGLRLGLGYSTSISSGGGSAFNFFLFTVLFPLNEFFSWRTNGTPYVDIDATAVNYANSLDVNHFLYRAFEEWNYMVIDTDVSNGYVLGTLPVDASELEGGGDWSLSGTDAALFTINTSTGQITVADAASLTAGNKAVTVTAPSGNSFAITVPVLDPANAGSIYTPAGFRIYDSTTGDSGNTGTSVTDAYSDRDDFDATPPSISYFKRGGSYTITNSNRYWLGTWPNSKSIIAYGDPSQPRPYVSCIVGYTGNDLIKVDPSRTAGNCIIIGMDFDGLNLPNNIYSDGSTEDFTIRHTNLRNNAVSDVDSFIGILMRNWRRVTLEFCEFSGIYGDNVYINRSHDIVNRWCTFNSVTGTGADAAQVVHEDNYDEVNKRITFEYCAFGVDETSNKGGLAIEGVEGIKIQFCVSNARLFGLNSAGWLVRNRYNYIYNALADRAAAGILGATDFPHGNAVVSRNTVYDAANAIQISGSRPDHAARYIDTNNGGWQHINQLDYGNVLINANDMFRIDQPFSGRLDYNIGTGSHSNGLVDITNANPGKVYYQNASGKIIEEGAVFKINGITSGMTEADGVYTKVTNRNAIGGTRNEQSYSGSFDLYDTAGNPIDTTSWGTYTYPNGQLNWLIDIVPKGIANLDYGSADGHIASFTSDGTSITINFDGEHDFWNPCNAHFKFGSYASSDGLWPITIIDDNSIRITPTTAPAAATLSGTVLIRGEVDNRIQSYINNYHMDDITTFQEPDVSPTFTGTCQEGFDVSVSYTLGVGQTGTPIWLINGQIIYSLIGESTIAVPFGYTDRFVDVFSEASDLACFIFIEDASGNTGIIDALWDDGRPIREITVTDYDSFGSIVYYEGTDLAGDDGSTFTWEDKSSNGYDATNGTAGEWPVTSGDINGLGALTFDDDKLNLPAGTYSFSNGAHTIVTLVQLDDAFDNNIIFTAGNDTEARCQIFFPVESNKVRYRFGEITPKNNDYTWTPDNDPHIVTATYDGTSVFSIQLDDNTPATNNLESGFTSTSVSISDASTRPPTTFGALAIYDSVLTADQLKAIKRKMWAEYELQNHKIYRDLRDYNFNTRVHWSAQDYYVDNWIDHVSGLELEKIGDPEHVISGFVLDGNDAFETAAVPTIPAIRDIHKTTGGVPVTICGIIRAGTWAGTQYIMSNIDFIAETAGFDIRVNGAGVVTFTQTRGGTTGSDFDQVSLGTLAANQDHFFAIAVDTPNSLLKYAFNADAFTTPSVAYSPKLTSTDPTEPLRIGVNALSNFLANGSEIKEIAFIEGYITDAQLAVIRDALMKKVN